MAVAILLASHGLLCKELKHSAEMIVGKKDNLSYIPLLPDTDLEDYRTNFINKVHDAPGNCLILDDVFGGTPFITASLAKSKNPNIHVEIVTGANLPMLLEILVGNEDKSLEEQKEIACKFGKDGIKCQFE